MAPPSHRLAVSPTRQFLALLRKNGTLLLRSRKSFLGLGGGLALLAQILVPVLFFALMCIPTYYIKPIQHGEQWESASPDLTSRAWSGPEPYSGPALNPSSEGNAHLLLVPDTPQVQLFARVLAKALACPMSGVKPFCPLHIPDSFHCMFIRNTTGPECTDYTTCINTPACYEHVLTEQLQLLSDESAAEALIRDQPQHFDALIVMEPAGGPVNPNGDPSNPRQPSAESSTGASKVPSAEVQDLGQTSADEHSALHDLRLPEAAAEGSVGAPLLHYSLRMNHTDVPPTSFLFDLFDVVPNRANGLGMYRRYWFFANLQHSIDRSLVGGALASGFATGGPSQPGKVQVFSNDTLPAAISLAVKPFPWPAATEDIGAAGAAVFFQILLVYAFMSPSRAAVADIVREKELRLREGMAIFGLTGGAYWASWALTHWAVLAASGVLCAVVGLYPFAESTFALMLSFYLLYGAALLAFSYFMSTLFSSSRVAGTSSQLLYSIATLPGFIVPAAYQYGGAAWYWAALLPPSGAALFAQALINFELSGSGIKLSTLAIPITQYGGFSVLRLFGMLAFDVLLWGGAAWYADKVLPREHGQRLPPWFLFTSVYWSSAPASKSAASHATAATAATAAGKAKAVRGSGTVMSDSHAADEEQGLLQHSEQLGILQSRDGGVEEEGEEVVVRVRGLHKSFATTAGGVKHAVDGVDLDIPRGRITALLGHNGAGKTTTLHILTGMQQPDAGSVLVNGLDIRTQMAAIRASLGVCPQFDILWPDLSVTEHLQLYAAIKGMDKRQSAVALAAAAEEVGLTPQLSVMAGELSGGQRRKLSVAIAFLGEPDLVVLDEPTSGMDPYSRRFTWELLRRRRAGCAIVLTTHSMEEADLLGDGIVVMAEGRVAAVGTPLELKQKYGLGYTLTLVLQPPTGPSLPAATSSAAQQAKEPRKDPEGSTRTQQPTGIPPAAAAAEAVAASPRLPTVGSSAQLLQHAEQARALEAVVMSAVPGARFLSAVGSELALLLPREAAATFAPLLRELEARKEELGLQSYGLSVTTLEEVFLKITEAAVPADTQQSTDVPSTAKNALPTHHLPPSAEQHISTFTPAGTSNASHNGLNGGSNGIVTGSAAGKAATVGGSRHPPDAANGSVGKREVNSGGGSRSGPGISTGGDGSSGSRGSSSSSHVRLHGWGLRGQQLRALLTKRALCSRRDKLAVLTQLVVPLLLVYLALWVSSLTLKSPEQAPLAMTRAVCMQGRHAILSASQAMRAGSELAFFTAAYPESDLIDVGTASLWSGGQRNGTLEQVLLQRWHTGALSYDAVHVVAMPNSTEMAAGAAIQLVLLVNQTAVSALPAAISAANSAILRHLLVPPTTSSGTFRNLDSLAETSNVQAAASLIKDTDAVPSSEDMDLLPSFFSVENTASLAAAFHGVGRHADHASGPVHRMLASEGLDSSADPSPLALQVTNRPLPLLASEPFVRIAQNLAGLQMVLCMTLATSVLSASFVVFLVREADSNSKHLQMVSGAPPLIFWLSNFLWDMVSYSLSAAAIIGLIALYNLDAFSGKRLAATAGLLAMFGPAGLSLTYLLHFLFKDEMRALQRLNSVFLLTGYLGFLVTWILGLIDSLLHPPHVHALNTAVQRLLQLLSPHYCFARGVYDVQASAGPALPFAPPPASPFSWSVFGLPMVHMAAQAVGYGLLVLLVDNGAWPKMYRLAQSVLHKLVTATGQPLDRWGGPTPRHESAASALLDAAAADADEDEDVARERLAVGLNQRSDCMVLLDGVIKGYPQGLFRPPVMAVRGLTLGVPPGECFGLLGVNGAGKTTTFKMLTGELSIDEGNAWVGGCSVVDNLQAARLLLGYCPQFEALPGAMTGREVLAMYGRLRGVPNTSIPSVASALLQRLGLSQYADSACGTYSGGNKRKLAVAVALVGEPPVVLLDEPSTGMDPGARRVMWGCLQVEVIGAGHTVVLSSHIMEECEALCTRIGIMAAGRLKCFGPVQHLKSRFGSGYILQVTSGGEHASNHQTSSHQTPNPATADIVRLVTSAAARAVLKDNDGRHFVFELPRDQVDLPAVFEAVEAARAAHQIDDYSLTQATLEQVFITLAGGSLHSSDGR